MMQAGQFTEPPPYQIPLAGSGAAAPPSGRSLQAPGEFTRMFAAEPAASENLPTPQAPLLHGGAATGAFSRRAAASAPPHPMSGPSEFTQMFKGPSPEAGPKPPALAAPAAPTPKVEKSPLTLILVMAGLLLLVVVVIVVFALTR